MTTLTWQFSNESNPEGGGGGLFELGVTECEECPKYAVGLFANADGSDSGLFAYCFEHMRSVSPLAASILLGSLDDEYSDLQLVLIDELGECPRCGGGIDTGAGFGQRDLECGDFCSGPAWEADGGQGQEACECGGEDEDAHCGWRGSYPIELYREKLMEKHRRGDAGHGPAVVAELVAEFMGKAPVKNIPVMEPKQ